MLGTLGFAWPLLGCAHGKDLAMTTNDASATDAQGVRRTVLASYPIDGVSGWELRLLLIEYPPGAIADPHTHPVPGVGYVLDGSFESAWGEDGAPATFAHQGESFVDRAHERHLFRNASATAPLRFLITYAIPIGMPGLAPA
jgi:quercetin dioxygenase-like cupin family protein